MTAPTERRTVIKAARPQTALVGKSSDSYAEIKRVAEGLRRTDPSLSEAQAITKVAAERRDLSRRYHDRKLAEIEAAEHTA